MLNRILATRYVAPLREGGSLPGLMEADDLGTYVVKFRGAGQGPKVLVAEIVVGELARRLGIRVPQMCAVELDPIIGRYEADEEVQDLLTASVGLNLAVDFLPGSFGYDGTGPVVADEAAAILWLDALVANVDRSWRNPNALRWHGDIWCIDHGAALYFQHSWSDVATGPQRFASAPYTWNDHIFAGYVGELPAVDEQLSAQVSAETLHEVLGLVPDEWLEPAPGAPTPDQVRNLYIRYLLARVAIPRTWLPTETSS